MHIDPVPRSRSLDDQPLVQLCLRLNNCEWAAEQLLALAARLRADIPGLGRLPGRAVIQCERSCRDLLDYITSKVVWYELEPSLVLTLYTPQPREARLSTSPVLGLLQPKLVEMRTTVAPRWSQRMLEGTLSTLAIAIAAVLELPSRRFERHHKTLVDEDVDALGTFFMRATAGVLEEQVVRAALSFLSALGEQACTAR